jgi:hypothetical protein
VGLGGCERLRDKLGRSVEAVIGPAGGEITSSDGRLTLTFPPGALSDNQTIVIRKRRPARLPDAFLGIDADSAYALEPDGLAFAKPVLARVLSQLDSSASDREIQVRNRLLLTEEGGTAGALGQLQMLIDADRSQLTARGLLRHFSTLVETRGAVTFAVDGLPKALPVGPTFPVHVGVSGRHNRPAPRPRSGRWRTPDAAGIPDRSAETSFGETGVS